MTVVSRQEWGARPPVAPPLPISPVGVVIHWEGPQIGILTPSAYPGLLRSIQNFHMNTTGWNDIAYNAIVSPHGQVFAGRGPGARSAANGTAAANASYVAICYAAGQGDPFTDAASGSPS